MTASDEMTVADIARENGWSHGYAWKWLLAKEKQYGDRVVWRRGRYGKDRKGQLVTTRSRLLTILPEESTKIILKLQSKVGRLEDRVRAAEGRSDGISRELIEFRKQSLEWFARADGRLKVASRVSPVVKG